MSLKTASRRRRRHNEKLIRQFEKELTSHTHEASRDAPSDKSRILSQQEQGEVDDLRQLYDQYTAFHKTPPDIDPSLMSITPTVIQVKRPNIYSYFYYE